MKILRNTGGWISASLVKRDVGILHNSSVHELCGQIHQEPKAVRPEPFSVGRRCCAVQLGTAIGRTGKGAKCLDVSTFIHSCLSFVTAVEVIDVID